MYASVLRRIKVGAKPVTKTKPIQHLDDEGKVTTTIVEFEDTEPIYAEPGDRIDVSEWKNLRSYVDGGYLLLITPGTDELIDHLVEQKVAERLASMGGLDEAVVAASARSSEARTTFLEDLAALNASAAKLTEDEKPADTKKGQRRSK